LLPGIETVENAQDDWRLVLAMNTHSCWRAVAFPPMGDDGRPFSSRVSTLIRCCCAVRLIRISTMTYKRIYCVLNMQANPDELFNIPGSASLRFEDGIYALKKT
jgi:hypothetical protein